MAESNLFDDLQDCLDSMGQAVDACASEECTVAEMWAEIDAGCQRLAALSAGDVGDDGDEDEDELGIEDELNFDEDDETDPATLDDEDDEALN